MREKKQDSAYAVIQLNALNFISVNDNDIYMFMENPDGEETVPAGMISFY